MIKMLIFVLIMFTVMFFSDCKNDLDVTAPYKDTTIVYGFLSPTDTVQYIKIYKAFIGDGNAVQFAQHADSFYFADILNVQLIQFIQGNAVDTILLTRDTLQPMTDGIFAKTPNIVYSTKNSIQIGSSYLLKIYNTKSRSIVTAQTDIPGNASLSEPNPFFDEIGLASAPVYAINWQSGINAKIYNTIMRFHYEEVSPSVTTAQFVDWTLGNKIVKNPSVQQYLDLQKNKEGFYQNLASKISIPDSGTYRVSGKVELIFIAGAEDYYYYQKINNATVGVSQSIPAYTNIQNGLGVFSAKTINRWSFDLDATSYDYLIHGPYTGNLKFY